MDAPAIAVMISGGGRTVMNLADRIEAGSLSARIAVVIASSSCPGAERSLARGLPTLVVPGEIPQEVLLRIFRDHSVEWVALGGYIKRLHIPPEFGGRVVNIHPALLPAFGGRGMYGMHVHRAVLDAGCKVSGCTVHFVNEEYDRGPIIGQRACEVLDDDTPESLGERVFALEKELYPLVLSKLLAGKVRLDPGGRRVRMIQ